MKNILRMNMREPVSTDPDRLVELCVKFGEAGAQERISCAIYDLATGMAALQDAYQVHDMTQITDMAVRMGRVANDIGMMGFARVADDVADCARVGASVPLSATLGRLRRVADTSLNATWDMKGMLG